MGLLAVAMLFYVSFWLIARLDQRRRMEFLQARVWKAASVGSAASLALVGLHRGVPRGLRDGALLPGPVLVRAGPAGLDLPRHGAPPRVVLGGVAWAVLKLGRKLPVRRFLAGALVIVMLSSVAVLGNAMRALQEAAVLDLHVLDGWPQPADLPGPGHRLLPDAAERARPRPTLLGGLRPRRASSPTATPGAVRRWPRRSSPSPTSDCPSASTRRCAEAMGVRIGVDVGGTFTKAVAIDLADGALLARAVVPTTHDDAAGLGRGRRAGGRRGRPTRSAPTRSSSSPTRPPRR